MHDIKQGENPLPYLLMFVGGIWALLGVGNIVLMPWITDGGPTLLANSQIGFLSAGIILNMFLFVLPGLSLLGIGYGLFLYIINNENKSVPSQNTEAVSTPRVPSTTARGKTISNTSETCPNCGESVSNHHTWCRSCGERFSIEKPPVRATEKNVNAKYLCAECNQPKTIDAKAPTGWCANCESITEDKRVALDEDKSIESKNDERDCLYTCSNCNSEKWDEHWCENCKKYTSNKS